MYCVRRANRVCPGLLDYCYYYYCYFDQNYQEIWIGHSLFVTSIFLRRLKEELTRQIYTVESLVPLPRPSRPLPGILPQKNNLPTLKFRNGSINTRHKEVVDKE